MVKLISLCIFVVGYALISQEHVLKINKTAISLLLGVCLWTLVIVYAHHDTESALILANSDIFSLVIFLLSAMTLVEIVTHFGLFDYIYEKIVKTRLSLKLQFVVICSLAFLFSTFINNITTTIVFIYIATRLFRGENLLHAGAAVVIASNAGGVFSPIGDVTSTILWLNGKFTAQQVFVMGALPAVCAFIVSTLLIMLKMKQSQIEKISKVRQIQPLEWLIIILSCLSFFLPIVMTFFELPAYMGLLIGLSIVWLVVEALKPRLPKASSMDISIESFFQRTDIASLYFFVGILLAVSALNYLGVLHDISQFIFTNEPSIMRVIVGNVLLGILSAVFDNIPLTAASLEIVKSSNPSLWVLLSYTVGFGGSLLLIGSGSGIVAMTILKELTFVKYFKIATLPVFLAYFLGIGVWYLQYILMK